MQLESEALSLQKDAAVLGTYESNAFILSLRKRDEFSTTHSFGYHRIPHIGVYGNDYTLALPMALLSLPPTTRYLEKLPQDVLNALELGHLTGSLTAPPPPSPLHLLSQRIVSNLHSHYHLTPDLQLRLIARELVNYSITSALSKLGLTAPQTQLWPKPLAFDSAPFTGYEHLQDKRPSVVSMGSPSSVDSEEEDSSKLPKTVSIQVEGTVIEEVEFDEWREGELEKDCLVGEDALLLVAKKIVKKALHLACKRWESMNRRSSIDYLISSTKRLKIASPSPPPALPEEERAFYEHGIATSGRSPRGWDTPSPNPETGHGKKRNRSESHNIMMMKELELFRQTQVTLTQEEEEEEGERVIAKPRRREGGRKDSATGFKSVSFLKQESMGELILDINRLSLQKPESESEEWYSSEEDCTVMSGITNPVGRRSSSPSPIPPPNSPTLLQVMRGGVRSPSPLLHTVLPTALRQVPEWDYGLEHEEQATCTSPEFQQRLSALQPTSETMVVVTSSCGEEPFLMATKDTFVPDMDYYIILHTCPPPGECQKFMCGNTDEVNLLYHCWLYPDVPCDPSIVSSEPLDMGVFQPRGVTPVHQDLQDAGVAFHHLQPRTVCIHSCHFSPENAQLQLSQNQQMHTFFSAARHGTRRVVALHLIPGAGEVEELLREGLTKCSTLNELLHQLSLTTPGSTQIIRTLVLP